MTFPDYLRDLADHLAAGEQLPLDDILASLARKREEIAAIWSARQGTPAEGTEAAHAELIAALELLCAAIDEVHDHLETGERDPLVRVILMAEEAKDRLNRVDYEARVALDSVWDEPLA